MFLWILCIILWTLLVLIVGIYSGYQTAKSELKKGEFESTVNNYANIQGPPGPVGATGPQGPPGKGFTDEWKSRMETLWKEHTQGSSKAADLPPNYYEDMAALRERLTRVERQAGMSV